MFTVDVKQQHNNNNNNRFSKHSNPCFSRILLISKFEKFQPDFHVQYLFTNCAICTILPICTTIHRYPIFSTRYSIMCKVYTGYCGTSEIKHGLCACTVDNPLAKARGLSLRTGAQTMLYLSLVNKCGQGDQKLA